MIVKLKFILTLAIFGTIGVISRFIPLSSSAIVFYRATLAALFLIAVSIFIHREFDFEGIKKNFKTLLIAGVFMGLNWVFQFEAFKVASVSVGTVCYNTMPIFVILLSPIVFNEKLTKEGILCVLLAMVGIVFVSNVINLGIKSTEILGCIYGLVGALFYALVVIVTKRLTEINSWDKIIFEFLVASIIMIPYMIYIDKSSLIFNTNLSDRDFLLGLIMLLLLCFVHTGLSYIVYFDSVDKLKAQEVAIFTYIDPVVALILSAVILKENLNLMQIVGAVLILASTFIYELIDLNKHKQKV